MGLGAASPDLDGPRRAYRASVLWGERVEEAELELAEPLEAPEPAGYALWDRMGMWTVAAAALVLIAYLYPIWNLLQLERFGSPGFKPF